MQALIGAVLATAIEKARRARKLASTGAVAALAVAALMIAGGASPTTAAATEGMTASLAPEVGLPPLTTPPAATTTYPARCRENFKPWSASEQELTDCGDTTTPLTEIVTEPNGDMMYEYGENGSTTTQIIPPASLDLATASPQEIEAHDIALPPQGTEGYDKVLQSVREWTSSTPPTTKAITTSANFGYTETEVSEVWAGIEDYAAPESFTTSQVEYNEPEDGATTNCSVAGVAFWTGISGDGVIAQAGSSQGYTGLGENELWYQLYGEGKGAVPTGIVAPPGRHVLAFVAYLTDRSYEAYIAVQGLEPKLYRFSGRYQGGHAEAIAEAPSWSDYFLLNFAHVKMAAFSDGSPISNYNYKDWVMKNEYTGDIKAWPTNPAAGEAKFEINHYLCR